MKKLIWTKHSLQRIKDRKIPKKYLTDAFYKPDKILDSRQRGTKKFIRYYGKHEAVVVAGPNDGGEWIVISCWINPPLQDSLDYKKDVWQRKYNSSSVWGKILLEIKKAIFNY